MRDTRIGIVDYHGDFRRMVTEMIPSRHQVVRVAPDATETDADLLVDHQDAALNGRFGLPFLVLPYNSVSERHVEGWNRDPNCVGVLDLSRDILRRFGNVELPVLSYTPFHPQTPLYEHAGTKVISLISNYGERYPDAFRLAQSLTPHVYGDPYVHDLDALKDARWLLHLKPASGFVCNAVTKALACGVPVIMDDQTWESGYFTNYLHHNHNCMVVPADEIGDVLRDLPEREYDRIKRNCVIDAPYFKRGFTWEDRWWET